MLKRKIESTIENYLKSNSNKIMLVDGARQVGKSYIIEELGKKIYKNFIEINLEDDSISTRRYSSLKGVDELYLT